MKRILIVRVDRLGDVLVSFPAVQRASSTLTGSEVVFAVQPYASELIPWRTFIFDPKGRHQGLPGLKRLVKELRESRFDAVVFLQPNFRMSLACVLARIPIRIGPLNRLFTFLFFNEGVRQKRSRVEKHEAEYNNDLVDRLLRRLGEHSQKSASALVSPKLDSAAEERIRIFLDRNGLERGRFRVVHPGMGGSALNLSPSQYEQLIRSWLEAGPVVLTGAEPERKLVEGYCDRIGDERVSVFVGETLSALGHLFLAADRVFAPSTGPLHLASELGVSVASVYPPIPVQSVKRWGPLGARAQVLVPDVDCPAHFKCFGSSCSFFPCMERVNLDKLNVE